MNNWVPFPGFDWSVWSEASTESLSNKEQRPILLSFIVSVGGATRGGFSAASLLLLFLSSIPRHSNISETHWSVKRSPIHGSPLRQEITLIVIRTRKVVNLKEGFNPSFRCKRNTFYAFLQKGKEKTFFPSPRNARLKIKIKFSIPGKTVSHWRNQQVTKFV